GECMHELQGPSQNNINNQLLTSMKSIEAIDLKTVVPSQLQTITAVNLPDLSVMKMVRCESFVVVGCNKSTIQIWSQKRLELLQEIKDLKCQIEIMALSRMMYPPEKHSWWCIPTNKTQVVVGCQNKGLTILTLRDVCRKRGGFDPFPNYL